MEDEFDRIMKFFTLDPKDKEEHLQEVFEDSVAYFERFKDIMVNGTPEEKKKAMDKVTALRDRIESETKEICKKTGLTQEELMAQAQNPENFTGPQWDTINEAKEKMETGVQEIKASIGKPPGEAATTAKSKKSKTSGKLRKKKSKNWIQS